MSEFKKSDKVVGADLYLKATADLEESVKRDLQVEDPTPEEAKAILSSESSEGNDGSSSCRDDSESSETGSP